MDSGCSASVLRLSLLGQSYFPTPIFARSYILDSLNRGLQNSLLKCSAIRCFRFLAQHSRRTSADQNRPQTHRTLNVAHERPLHQGQRPHLHLHQGQRPHLHLHQGQRPNIMALKKQQAKRRSPCAPMSLHQSRTRDGHDQRPMCRRRRACEQLHPLEVVDPQQSP